MDETEAEKVSDFYKKIKPHRRKSSRCGQCCYSYSQQKVDKKGTSLFVLQDKQIVSESKFVDMFDNYTIVEYFTKLNDINQKLSIDTTSIKSSFKSVYYQMLYSFGRMYFANKYVADEVSISLEPFIRIFDEKVIQLQELLFTNNNSNETLLRLGNIQDQIIQEFDRKYSYIDR